jgi:hypothetical protein
MKSPYKFQKLQNKCNWSRPGFVASPCLKGTNVAILAVTTLEQKARGYFGREMHIRPSWGTKRERGCRFSLGKRHCDINLPSGWRQDGTGRSEETHRADRAAVGESRKGDQGVAEGGTVRRIPTHFRGRQSFDTKYTLLKSPHKM